MSFLAIEQSKPKNIYGNDLKMEEKYIYASDEKIKKISESLIEKHKQAYILLANV